MTEVIEAKKTDLRIERFAREYVIDLNGEKAAIRAGYNVRSAAAQASRLLKKVKVREAIARIQARHADKLELKAENVLAELARIGFANMRDYVRTDANGDVFIDLSDLTREQAAAIQEITVEEYTDGKGPQARTVKSTKFKLADKRGALDSISKHLGFVKERIELTGKDGGPIVTAGVDLSKLSLEEKLQLEALLNKTSAEGSTP